MDITNFELEMLALTLNGIGFRIRSMNLEPEGAKLPFRSYKTPDKTVRGGRIVLVIDALPPHWLEEKSEVGYRPPPASHVSHRNKQIKTKAPSLGFKLLQHGLDRNKAGLIRLGIFLESIGL